MIYSLRVIYFSATNEGELQNTYDNYPQSYMDAIYGPSTAVAKSNSDLIKKKSTSVSPEILTNNSSVDSDVVVNQYKPRDSSPELIDTRNSSINYQSSFDSDILVKIDPIGSDISTNKPKLSNPKGSNLLLSSTPEFRSNNSSIDSDILVNHKKSSVNHVDSSLDPIGSSNDSDISKNKPKLSNPEGNNLLLKISTTSDDQTKVVPTSDMSSESSVVDEYDSFMKNGNL